MNGGQRVSLVAQGVDDPTVASPDQTLAVSTSADTGAAVSNAYAVVAAAPVSTSTVATTPPAAAVGSPVHVTVTELDTFGNPVAGDSVSLAPQVGSHALVTPPTATTSPQGVATFAVTDQSVEQVDLTASDTTAEVTFTEQPTVSFVTPEVSAVTVTPKVLSAGTITNLSVDFTTSAAGMLGPGTTISVVGPPNGSWPTVAADYVLSASAITAVAGRGTAATPLVISLSASSIGGGVVATLTVHGFKAPSAAGVIHLTLETSSDDGGFVASNTITVTPGPAVPGSTVVSSATSAPIGSTVTITVTVVDQFDNRIPGATVSLTASAGSHRDGLARIGANLGQRSCHLHRVRRGRRDHHPHGTRRLRRLLADLDRDVRGAATTSTTTRPARFRLLAGGLQRGGSSASATPPSLARPGS